MTFETAGASPACRTGTFKPTRSRWISATWPLLLLAALGACGGDDDPKAAQAAANADSASVAWNASSTLDVTSNDTIANGTASIAVTTPPMHGTATVSGTSIQYKPADGYFGPDSMGYTLTVGSAASQTDVALNVTAKVTLSGTVSDGPLPGASVVATIGAATLPAVIADGSGAYQVTVETSDPSAYISLKAQGADAQSHVVLTTLVGDAQAAAAAATSGTVNASSLPALNVTHLSTAVAVLTQRALGKPPVSSAEVGSVQGLFTSGEVIDMATAIKLVVDKGVALPAGAADTLALVSDAGAYQIFVRAQVAADPVGFTQTQQEVLADPLLAVVPVVPGADGTATTMLLVLGQGAYAQPATRLILQADKTARVESHAVSGATWALDDKDTVITFDSPIRSTGFSPDLDPVTGQQNEVESRQTGIVIRQLAGSAGMTVQDVSEFEYLDGSRTGTVVKNETFVTSQAMVSKLGTLTAADFAIGTRWAGVLATQGSPSDSILDQDILRIVDDSHAQFERSQQAGTWRLVDGSLELTIDSVLFTYSRLFTGPRGEERWLIEKRVDSTLLWVYDAAMFKAQSGAAFTTAGLTQNWESYINVGVTSDSFFVGLAADGTSIETTVTVGEGESARTGLVWALGADGQMAQSRLLCDDDSGQCAPRLRRAWQPIGTVGSRIYVMEHRVTDPDTNTGQYRVNVYTATP